MEKKSNMNEELNPNETTDHFRQDDVHNFILSTSVSQPQICTVASNIKPTNIKVLPSVKNNNYYEGFIGNKKVLCTEINNVTYINGANLIAPKI
jgi:hypothetical protein